MAGHNTVVSPNNSETQLPTLVESSHTSTVWANTWHPGSKAPRSRITLPRSTILRYSVTSTLARSQEARIPDPVYRTYLPNSESGRRMVPSRTVDTKHWVCGSYPRCPFQLLLGNLAWQSERLHHQRSLPQRGRCGPNRGEC